MQLGIIENRQTDRQKKKQGIYQSHPCGECPGPGCPIGGGGLPNGVPCWDVLVVVVVASPVNMGYGTTFIAAIPLASGQTGNPMAGWGG